MSQARTGSNPVLQAHSLVKHYHAGGLSLRRKHDKVRAVDGIDLRVWDGQTLAIVGESGCGKTTTSRLLLGIERPTSGRVSFDGSDIWKLRGRAHQTFRRAVQAVFQDPWSSLNPRQRVEEIIAEPMTVVEGIRGKELRVRVDHLLDSVGLDSSLRRSFPHEFSGGMRQRVAVARAVALRPRILILDEPVSALDVSVRAQVMNLLKDLQVEFGMAYVLISHDLATVRYLSDEVAVMYLGETVEVAGARRLFSAPSHPYTKALISAAIPEEPGDTRERIVLGGDVPSPSNPPSGCRFHTRCWLYERLGQPDRCRTDAPALTERAEDQAASCHYSSTPAAQVDVGLRGRDHSDSPVQRP